MKTFEYYLRVHNRNGLRNDGRAPPSRVHYSRNYNNAFCERLGDQAHIFYCISRVGGS